jgi:hypothetical protein
MAVLPLLLTVVLKRMKTRILFFKFITKYDEKEEKENVFPAGSVQPWSIVFRRTGTGSSLFLSHVLATQAPLSTYWYCHVLCLHSIVIYNVE